MRMSPTARTPYSEPRARPCVSSGIEYGKNTRTTSRKSTAPPAMRVPSALRPGRCQRSRARARGSRGGRGGRSVPRDAGGGGQVRAVRHLRELTEVEAGTLDLHVRAGLAVVRRPGVLVEVDDPCVLGPVPVARSDGE